MSDLFAGILMLAGTFYVLVSALGALRMPDLFLRMHAATKAGTLGAGLILAAALVVFATTAVATKAVLTFVFLLLTAPVAAHVLGRAAYYDGVPLWERTEVDALKGKYDEAETRGVGMISEPGGMGEGGVTGVVPVPPESGDEKG